MQDYFFPKPFVTVHEALAHFEECSVEIGEMQPLWGVMLTKLVWSHEMSNKWCQDRIDATVASIEERAGGGFGKRRASPFDKEICAWLGIKPPRTLSKLDLGEAKPAGQSIVVQQEAPSDGLQREQCNSCGELVALIKGNFPPKCRFCHKSPAPSPPAKTTARRQAAANPAGGE
jgi:hypothetical protein